MKTIVLNPEFIELNAAVLGDNFLSKVDKNLKHDDIIFVLNEKQLFSNNLFIFTQDTCEIVTSDRRLRKLKDGVEKIYYSEVDQIDISIGTRSTILEKMITFNLYSKNDKLFSIKCHTVKRNDGKYYITNNQSQTLVKLLRLLTNKTNLDTFEQQLIKTKLEQKRICKILSFEEEAKHVWVSGLSNDLIEEFFLCALLVSNEREVIRLVEALDIAIMNLIKSALTFYFNLALSGKGEKALKNINDLILDFVHAIRSTLNKRDTLFSFLPEGSSGHSSLFKYSDSVINKFYDWWNENKPESGLNGLLEKAVVKPLIFIRTGKIYDFGDDAIVRYNEELSKIIGLQIDNLKPPDVEGVKPEDATKAFLDVINNEIDKIISNREQGIKVDFDNIKKKVPQKVACISCGSMILPNTAKQTGGLCMPCYKK